VNQVAETEERVTRVDVNRLPRQPVHHEEGGPEQPARRLGPTAEGELGTRRHPLEGLELDSLHAADDDDRR
jgi:hypothetical protein